MSILHGIDPSHQLLLTLKNHQKLLKPGKITWLPPMLATLTKERFSNKEWLFECKYDGIRGLVFKDGNSVKILSRNQLDIRKNYPELLQEFLNEKTSQFIVDGEIVAFRDKITSFSALQQRMHINKNRDLVSEIPVYFYAFDILYLDGFYLEKIPLIQRKELLLKSLQYKEFIRYSQHILGDGIKFYQTACQNGWEGVMAKRINSIYEHNRSSNWLKFKCGYQQEFVIGGFTLPKGARIGFGALLIGYYQNGQLKYAGKVGSGYTAVTLKELYGALKKLEISTSPFTEPISEHHAIWVKPTLIAEVKFTEWTKDGKLRHPTFQGLRTDKDPKEVRREME